MKITPVRTLALAGLVASALAFSSTSASAIDVRLGFGPPPPVVVEHPYGRPYPGAYWVEGHYEWIDGRYVWRGGYWDRPPYPGARWIPGHYVRHDGAYFFRPGHWR